MVTHSLHAWELLQEPGVRKEAPNLLGDGCKWEGHTPDIDPLQSNLVIRVFKRIWPRLDVEAMLVASHGVNPRL